MLAERVDDRLSVSADQLPDVRRLRPCPAPLIPEDAVHHAAGLRFAETDARVPPALQVSIVLVTQ